MRSRRLVRCAGCGLPAPTECLCADATPAAARTRVLVIAHHREWRRTSNTSRLLLKALSRVEVRIRGERDVLPDESPVAGRRLVLFPSDEARELSPADARDDLVLVVPEGSWSQARRTIRREAVFEGVEHVRLPVAQRSRYRLRRAPRLGELSTFEAVLWALTVLEPEAHFEDAWRLFDRFVDRSLALRGRRSVFSAPVP